MDNNDEKFSFVKETVIDKKSRIKKMLLRLAANAVLIVVACIVTMLLYDKFISNDDQVDDKKDINKADITLVDKDETTTGTEATTDETLSKEEQVKNQIRSSVMAFTKYSDQRIEPESFIGVVLSVSNQVIVITQYTNVQDASEIYTEIGAAQGLPVKIMNSYEELNLAFLSIDVERVADSDLSGLIATNISGNNNPTVASHMYYYGEVAGAGLTLTYGDVVSQGEENFIFDIVYNNYMVDTKVSGVKNGFIFDISGNLMAMSDIRDSENSKMTVLDVASLRIIINNVVNKGYFTYIGIVGYKVTDEIAALVGVQLPDGMYVTDVKEDSPAYEAGIMVGDIIYKINTSNIESLRDIRKLIDGQEAASEVDVYFYRRLGNRFNTYNTTVTLQER